MIRSKTQTKKRNQILLVAAVVLLALSAFTYRDTVQRADRFERGQKFLPHLDLDQVAEIVLREGRQVDAAAGDSEVVLRRTAEGGRFVVRSADGYRADNAAVNRLLRKLLELQLEKEVGEATDELAERLGVASGEDGGLPEGALEVALRDTSDQDIVRFLMGDPFEGGRAGGSSGRYLRRLDAAEGERGTIYLTRGRFDLAVESDAFLDKEILDVPRADLVAIRGDGFALVRGEDGELTLEGLSEGERESSRATSLRGVLSPLRFTSHHLADAPEVRDLNFERGLRMELGDGSGYVVELARSGDLENYIRVRGFHSTEQVLIERDASEDEVRETSELLVRADEIARFDEFHGSWIYGVSGTVADRVGVEASELVRE